MKQYDAIIIGFGKGGKTLAAALGNAGKKTALIEKSAEMYGGTCINMGCIPTKFLVRKAKKAMELDSFEEKSKLYTQAMEEKNALTSSLRGKNLVKAKNIPKVSVITGTARLVSPHEVEVTGQEDTEILTGDTIFLNTGSVPVTPAIDGLEGNPNVVTSEGLLALKTLPRKLVVIGGGYIGVEFASLRKPGNPDPEWFPFSPQRGCRHRRGSQIQPEEQKRPNPDKCGNKVHLHQERSSHRCS